MRRKLLLLALITSFILGLWKTGPYWLLLGTTSLVGSGGFTCAANINVQGTANPQGTASTSTLNQLSTTVTGNPGITMTFGTGANQFNILIAQDRTLTASSSETLDINTGLADLFDGSPTMTHLKYVAFYIISGGDTTGLTAVSGASNGFVGYGIQTTSAGPTVYPNSCGFQNGEPSAGITVSSSLANIKFTNNSSSVSVTYRVIFAGVGT
jgi:hypothetical protein